MTSQGNRISYPCTLAIRAHNGKLLRKNRAAWLNAIVAKRGSRHIYLKTHIIGYGEIVIFLRPPVLEEMLQFLVDYSQKRLSRLTLKEKTLIYGKPVKHKYNIKDKTQSI